MGDSPLQFLLVILGGAFTFVSCYETGALLLNRLNLALTTEELVPLQFVCGAACVSLFVFALCAASVATPFTLLMLGFALIAFRRFLPKSGRKTRFAPIALPSKAKLALGAGLSAFLLLYLLNALAPETSPDGTAYHLALVKQYLQTRGFGRITTNMYANFPQGTEMLFLMAFSIGAHSAASLVEFFFLLALPLLVLSYARRFRIEPAGVAASVWVFLSPVFAIAGTCAYNDAAGACVVFSVFYLLRLWEEGRQDAFLSLAGLMAGFAYSIKYSLAIVVPYSAAFVLLRLWRDPLKAARALSVLISCAAVIILPWMIKNWIIVSNPFSPFLNRLFPNPYVTINFERDYLSTIAMSRGAPGFLRIWDSIVDGSHTAGLIGPIFLLFPLAAISLFSREGRRLLSAAAVFALPALGNIGTRFLMPAVPFLALSIGLVVCRARWALYSLVAICLVLSWPSVVERYCGAGAWRLTGWPIEDAFRLRPEREILKRRLGGGYDVAQMIDSKVPHTGRVYSFGSPPESYFDRQVIVSYESAYALRIRDILWTPLKTEQWASGHLHFSFPAHMIRGLRVLQTAKAIEEWSISEFRIYNGTEQITQSPEWRIDAKPNPWNIWMAFDGNPVTRWRSNENIWNGMRVTVDIGRPQMVDAVALDYSHDQWNVRLKLEEENSEGVWRPINEPPTLADDPVLRDYRALATRAVRGLGITHILVEDGQFLADDFRRDPAKWNLSFIGSAGNFSLYVIAH